MIVKVQLSVASSEDGDEPLAVVDIGEEVEAQKW